MFAMDKVVYLTAVNNTSVIMGVRVSLGMGVRMSAVQGRETRCHGGCGVESDCNSVSQMSA